MNTGIKVIIFIAITLIILATLSVIKESGGGAVMWLGAIAIPLIYKSLFSKKDEDNKGDDITLNKDK